MSELVRISPNGTRVRTIPATVQHFSPQRAALHAKKRVAAYARVSTDEEEQLTSYEAQVDSTPDTFKPTLTGSLSRSMPTRAYRAPIPKSARISIE